MKATFKLEPFPHVLLKDFYTKGEWEGVMREIKNLDPHLLPPEYSGSARHAKTGALLKYNSGIFLSEAMPKAEMIKFSRNHMTHELTEQVDCKWWVDMWTKQNWQRWMLSRYADGQYYNPHSDQSMFTTLIWLHEEPKPFTGGDLIFWEYDKYTIPCHNNTGVIFFGSTTHEVPPVKGNGRYTLTCFSTVQSK